MLLHKFKLYKLDWKEEATQRTRQFFRLNISPFKCAKRQRISWHLCTFEKYYLLKLDDTNVERNLSFGKNPKLSDRLKLYLADFYYVPFGNGHSLTISVTSLVFLKKYLGVFINSSGIIFGSWSPKFLKCASWVTMTQIWEIFCLNWSHCESRCVQKNQCDQIGRFVVLWATF